MDSHPQDRLVEDLAGILTKHQLKQDITFHCTCDREPYGQRTRMAGDRRRIEAMHVFHQAEVLAAAGATLATRDPRERFIRRIKDQPQA